MLSGFLAMIVAGLALTAGSLARRARSPGFPAPAVLAERVLAVAGLASALLVSVYLVFAPSYRTVTISEGQTQGVESTQTLLEVNGPWVFVPLSVPVLLAALPLTVRKSPLRPVVTGASATLVSAFVLIAGFSIGFAYLPSALFLLGASTAAFASPRAGA